MNVEHFEHRTLNDLNTKKIQPGDSSLEGETPLSRTCRATGRLEGLSPSTKTHRTSNIERPTWNIE